MEGYKYIIFLVFFIFSCEKSNRIDGIQNLSFCDSSNFDSKTLSVLSFNRLDGTSLNSFSNLIELLDPDIIGLQESYEIGSQIANRFDYCFYGSENNSLAVLSKYPIDIVDDIYCKINLNASLYINFFNVHLSSIPYQPHDIRDMLITTPYQAIYQAEQTRGLEVDLLASNVSNVKEDNNMPIIITGGFSEPSHLDWIVDTQNPLLFSTENGLNQFIVDWPTSKKMLDVGMIDAYRFLYPDPIQHPGYTWTPNISLNEIHDRIDFIYYADNQLLNLNNVQIIGPDQFSDVMINDYQSDHRAVLAVFNVNILN